MSQVSADIKALVDKGFTCWNSGEIDLMADDYADDAEVDTTAAVPDGRSYKGARSSSGTSTTCGMHGTACAWNLCMSPAVGGGRFLVEVAASGDDSLANLGPSCARCNRGWR